MQVFFDGVGKPEGAIDTGGPKREYLSMCLRAAVDPAEADICIFEGHEHRLDLRNDMSGMSYFSGVTALLTDTRAALS